MSKRKYIYFAEIERFGYTLQVIALTKEEAEEAMKEEYIRAFIDANGYDPREDEDDYISGETYWEVFLDELHIEKRELNKVEWN